MCHQNQEPDGGVNYQLQRNRYLDGGCDGYVGTAMQPVLRQKAHLGGYVGAAMHLLLQVKVHPGGVWVTPCVGVVAELSKTIPPHIPLKSRQLGDGDVVSQLFLTLVGVCGAPYVGRDVQNKAHHHLVVNGYGALYAVCAENLNRLLQHLQHLLVRLMIINITNIPSLQFTWSKIIHFMGASWADDVLFG